MQMVYTCKTYRSDNCWTVLDDLMWFCHPCCSLLLIIQTKKLWHSITCVWNSGKNYPVQAVSHQAITKTLCYMSWPSLASPFSNYPNHTFWGSVAISTSCILGLCCLRSEFLQRLPHSSCKIFDDWKTSEQPDSANPTVPYKHWDLPVASIILPFSYTDISLCSHPVGFKLSDALWSWYIWAAPTSSFNCSAFQLYWCIIVFTSYWIQAIRCPVIMIHLSSQILQTLPSLINIETYQ